MSLLASRVLTASLCSVKPTIAPHPKLSITRTITRRFVTRQKGAHTLTYSVLEEIWTQVQVAAYELLTTTSLNVA